MVTMQEKHVVSWKKEETHPYKKKKKEQLFKT